MLNYNKQLIHNPLWRKNAKWIAKIDRRLDRLEAEFATIKQRADELTTEFKRLSPEYTKLMERTEQINKEHRTLLEQRWTSNFLSTYNYWCPIKTFSYL